MRSISTKLILAFLSIGIISVAIIALSALWNTRAEFIRFLTDQNQTGIVTELSDYHRINGSWDGVETALIQNRNPQQPGMMPRPGHMPFTLTDEQGIVILSNERYKSGEKISRSDLRNGIIITEDGNVIGILVPMRTPFEGQPREVEFIERVNLTLFYGAMIGAGGHCILLQEPPACQKSAADRT